VTSAAGQLTKETGALAALKDDRTTTANPLARPTPGVGGTGLDLVGVVEHLRQAIALLDQPSRFDSVRFPDRGDGRRAGLHTSDLESQVPDRAKVKSSDG